MGVFVYIILLNKLNLFNFKFFPFKNIFKIVISSVLMAVILVFGLEYFHDSFDYFNKFKSIYLLFIVSFVATIYLISCYLLGVLNIKNYKTN